jgi:hypothetical protein
VRTVRACVCVCVLSDGRLQILLQKKQLGIDNPFATLYFITPIMGTCLALIGFFIEQWWLLVRAHPAHLLTYAHIHKGSSMHTRTN